MPSAFLSQLVCPAVPGLFAERNVREYERQCKVLEAQVAEMEDLQHTEVELKKTQAKLERYGLLYLC